jgi:hypothetical protein
MPPRARKAWSSESRSASEMKRNPSRKLLLPAPFGPTRNIGERSGKLQAAMLL